MAWDNSWEKVFTEQDWGRYPSESLIRFVAKNFCNSDRKKTKILEIGCGTGANLWYLSRESFKTYGIDGSKTAIKKAEKRLKDEKLSVELVTGDIANLPYESECFDAVIDVECLYCNSFNDTVNILKDIKRVMKSNALFYSRTFNSDMYIGNNRHVVADSEYNNIDHGPLAGKGFVRLTDKHMIERLYGSLFTIISIDEQRYTVESGKYTISEWVIVCKKDND
jgi:ubiquinone/menaquinone biosynthesis C-methylase UbiE